ncbi:MAG: hypothetical protein ACLQVK_12420 [Acidimicrobiales bacterium]
MGETRPNLVVDRQWHDAVSNSVVLASGYGRCGVDRAEGAWGRPESWRRAQARDLDALVRPLQDGLQLRDALRNALLSLYFAVEEGRHLGSL